MDKYVILVFNNYDEFNVLGNYMFSSHEEANDVLNKIPEIWSKKYHREFEITPESEQEEISDLTIAIRSKGNPYEEYEEYYTFDIVKLSEYTGGING